MQRGKLRPEPVRPVLTTVVAPAPPGSAVAVGTVEPRFKTDIGFRVLGRLIARPVNVGDLVDQGQTTRHDRLDDNLKLAVQTARAELAPAQGATGECNCNGGTKTHPDRE